MGGLARFSVAVGEDLLKRFDRLIRESGYSNRSEALRDLIRDRLVAEQWAAGEEVVATITLVYDHHVRDLAERLTQVQHQRTDRIISSLHVHLNHDNCLEVIVTRGSAHDVKELAGLLIGSRGVKHGGLVMTTTGEEL
ncbi:MAG TPA: nickel-responsive transcriptional regulator NikR [Candidatus Latescibacteria bacterium]|nr:nickel-responsive transcriptional regulator NikR [Candidatus Latescibacterota bacterium]HOF61622.1 nickel-responsive transcriptional regulator NikR [Candidatus Latescibacterota bacterium]HOS64487.1 nickel-responsive transcriptional regulator NikR [Candidatus Latescibacterota bacterium]HPK74038.1 nickel-responsive transcriptional regulator NikR [Candidatus Latescibacterota bacterium]